MQLTSPIVLTDEEEVTAMPAMACVKIVIVHVEARMLYLTRIGHTPVHAVRRSRLLSILSGILFCFFFLAGSPFFFVSSHLQVVGVVHRRSIL